MALIRGLERLDGVLLDGLDFCKIAYETLAAVQSEAGGMRELRVLTTPRAKKLLEEILPIAAFVQSRYGPGLKIRVRWRGGSQRYDARILCSGSQVRHLGLPSAQHLEVTSAVHQNDHLAREHLHCEGGSFGPHGTRRDPVTKRTVSVPTVRRQEDLERELATLVACRITKKTSIPYPRNTTLIVRCAPYPPLHDDEWGRAVRGLRQETHPKRFPEIVLYDVVTNRVTTLSKRTSRR